MDGVVSTLIRLIVRIQPLTLLQGFHMDFAQIFHIFRLKILVTYA